MRGIVEKYSTWIGIGLIIISLVGGVLLMVKKGAWASGETQNQPTENRDKEISDLKSKISDLEKQIADSKSVVAAPSSPAGEETATSPSSATKSVTPSGKININTATAAQLDSLPGIGPTYSQRIVDYRNTNGPFSSIDKIQNVKGIGPKTFDKFKDLITI